MGADEGWVSVVAGGDHVAGTNYDGTGAAHDSTERCSALIPDRTPTLSAPGREGGTASRC